MSDKQKKLSRWYFGGVASAMAACCTHPLDLLKVHLQTQQEGKVNIVKTTVKIVREQGNIKRPKKKWNTLWHSPVLKNVLQIV